jgi:hypothetical protein
LQFRNAQWNRFSVRWWNAEIEYHFTSSLCVEQNHWQRWTCPTIAGMHHHTLVSLQGATHQKRLADRLRSLLHLQSLGRKETDKERLTKYKNFDMCHNFGLNVPRLIEPSKEFLEKPLNLEVS